MTGPEDTPVGRRATVFVHQEDWLPVVLPLGPRDHEDLTVMFSNVFPDVVVIASAWALHVALYGLQQGTPEAIQRALEMLGCDLDIPCDDAGRSLPVGPPQGWVK